MSDPLTMILNDPIALQLLKGEGIEPFWQGQEASKVTINGQTVGLIDPQDVGTLVEATMILVSKWYPRSLAAGQKG